MNIFLYFKLLPFKRIRILAVVAAYAVTTAGPISAETTNEIGSSGSINVDCEEAGTATVSAAFPSGLPANATVYAQWTDLSNIKASSYEPGQITNNLVTWVGHIQGLDKQDVGFGIRNCPGGGHGTLKLFVTY